MIPPIERVIPLVNEHHFTTYFLLPLRAENETPSLREERFISHSMRPVDVGEVELADGRVCNRVCDVLDLRGVGHIVSMEIQLAFFVEFLQLLRRDLLAQRGRCYHGRLGDKNRRGLARGHGNRDLDDRGLSDSVCVGVRRRMTERAVERCKGWH